jgi:serine/threonine protein kinase
MPFEGEKNLEQLAYKICNLQLKVDQTFFQNKFNCSLYKLMLGCLTKNPVERYDSSQVFNYKWN